MPGVDWPDLGPRPPLVPSVPPVKPGVIPEPPVASTPAIPRVIARANWTRNGPLMRDINPMGGVSKITIHHQGNPQPVYFTDRQSTIQELEKTRNAHRARGWADIGYHFIVDRAGYVWEGRNIAYQGAHVRDHNENNIGVMCLGNFDLQAPSDAQLASLEYTVRELRRQYKISTRHIYTHQEINRTACPGRALQPRVVAMRSRNMFA